MGSGFSTQGTDEWKQATASNNPLGWGVDSLRCSNSNVKNSAKVTIPLGGEWILYTYLTSNDIQELVTIPLGGEWILYGIYMYMVIRSWVTIPLGGEWILYFLRSMRNFF